MPGINDGSETITGQKVAMPCPSCRGGLRKGLLWIGGKDYVECPDCGGPSGGHPGVFVMYEEEITPGTIVFTHGLRDGLPAVAVAAKREGVT